MSITKLAALTLAIVVTQGSATAAPSLRSAAPVARVVAALHTSVAPGAERAGSRAAERGWGLALAGLIGLWAIGRRRIDSPGQRLQARQRTRLP